VLRAQSQLGNHKSFENWIYRHHQINKAVLKMAAFWAATPQISVVITKWAVPFTIKSVEISHPHKNYSELTSG
jgi:hypothetical protein